jgi:uncharacterized protein YndB with AHSA1/START domain
VSSNTMPRRSLLQRLVALSSGLLIAAKTPATPKASDSGAADGLSRTAEAIQQEVLFDASPQRVYQALTTTKDFDMVTRLSDGAVLLDAAGAKPTSISTAVGGSFTLFGGYIEGRHLEMRPNERLVQAWRAGSWRPGSFSIVAFNFTPTGGRTRLDFEHRGFPDGNGTSLAQGWHSHYWEPLAKYLTQS